MNYKLVHVTTIQQVEFFQKALVELIQLVISKSKSNATVSRIMEIIISGLGRPEFRLYVVIDENYQAVAYFIILLSLDDSGDMMAYIYHHSSKVGLMPDINHKIEELLKVQGVKIMKFVTQRNERAMDEVLGDGWKAVGTAFEKELKGE